MNYGEGNIRLQVVVSQFDSLYLKVWARAHGKTPSTFAGQVLALCIEKKMDLIDDLAARQAKDAGLSVEDWLLRLEGGEVE